MDDARNWFRRNGLTRPARGRWLAGICAGLGRKYEVPAEVVRVAFVLSLFLPGPQTLVYLALWFLMPEEQTAPEAYWRP